VNILLIEPDRVLAKTYATALKAAGHKVKQAFTAQGGIHQADLQRPDVVILELQLVSHSGIEFLYEFRSYEDWQTVPVIIHSAVPPAEFATNRQLLQTHLGVSDYYYKPRTTLAALQAAVQRYSFVGK
jgi:DNA-binding response OmpR family regulator